MLTEQMTAVADRDVAVLYEVDATPLRQVVFADVAAGLALLSALLLAFGARGPVPAAVFGATVLVAPGAMWCELARPRDGVERVLVTLGLSVVTWMAVANVLLTFQLWHPALGAQAVLLLTVGLYLLRRKAWLQTQLQRRRQQSDVLGEPARRWSPPGEALAVCASLSLWAISCRRIDTAAIGDWGLIAALPLTWFLALLIAVLTAARAATAAFTSGRRVALTLAPVLVIIYATMPIVASTIRYPWTYKHIGVIRLLDTTGQLHPDVDIYNNFSGFFGLGALVRGATGVDPTSYAAWFQLCAEAVVLLAVWLLVKRCTDSVRVAHVASLIYLVTNWVGQNYFSPQAFGTVFGLSTLALCFSWFSTPEASRIPVLGGLLGRLSPHSPPVEDTRTRWHRRVVIGAMFLGLMMSHPLTPAAVVGTIVASWILGWLRDKRLLALLALVGLVWLAACWRYFAGNSFDLGFGGSLTNNAAGNSDVELVANLPAGVQTVGEITRLFSVGVWGLAAVGVALCLWTMRRVGILLIAALVPFGILVVQSYGGEAIYRVYLYSLPLMAALIAFALVNAAPVQTRTLVPQNLLRTSLLVVALTGGFMVAHFGREQLNLVDPSEVAMENWIALHVEDPALIAQFADTYPAASSWRYPSFQISDTYTPQIADMLGRPDAMPTVAELDDVADDLLVLTPGTPYVVLGPGMIESLRATDRLSFKNTAEAADFLSSNPHFKLVHRIDDTYLFEITRTDTE